MHLLARVQTLLQESTWLSGEMGASRERGADYNDRGWLKNSLLRMFSGKARTGRKNKKGWGSHEGGRNATLKTQVLFIKGILALIKRGNRIRTS